ncbi:molybdopterin-dependent oxidoreductase [Chlorobium ferrooxidans]|uniref:Oxidoreductase molybdopterin-binding domain-containing protein n=1 Tax=Chlorobium ferrooxidans DSM 13031 TaxID=377431 RepID=Q0YQ03_9CHLB|nr:molybdopterin-dependent oxidoreductase [Chlorobium ferrooxidans]EAT58390.1 conserved hypothetical protein [Chlorobium ferrooxidans DSM 13031]
MKKIERFSLAAFLSLFLLTFSPFSAQAKSEWRESETVRVSGLVENPFTITIESLKKMNVSERRNAAIVCASGETRQTMQSFRGVLLRDILDAAKIVMPNSRERGEYQILVRSSDSYNVLFSYDELYFGAAGDDILLVFEEDGKPIEKEGRFVLFCPSDKVTAPRLVKWVDRIEVSKINLAPSTAQCK